MKKIVFLLSAILLVGGSASAQKNNVSKAKAKILSETPDTKAAKEAILLALENPTTKDLASTWFTAGDVFYTIYNEQQKIQWTQKKGDQALMATSLKSALDSYSKADSLDQLPNEKGKINPKFRKKIVEKVKGFQRGFIDAGSYYYEKKDFMKSFDMFQTYIQYPNLKYMKGQGLEKDTLIPMITYYCGLSATQAEKPAISVKYFEQIKDTIESQWVYGRLCSEYLILKDTANLIRMYKLGAQKFPTEPFYTSNLINYYINEDLMDEALIWINQALNQDQKSPILWNVKGRILENTNKLDECKVCYQKALDLDPNYADALGNMGRLYYNKAVEELDRINTIRDDKKYRAEKVILKDLFEQARPFFEKAYSINPNDRDFVIALRGIYYNTGNDEKYKIMDQRIREMK